MRLTLLAIIFLLILTLANAFLYRKGVRLASAHDFAPVQLTQHRSQHYEWDAFVWREIGAIVVTAVLFAGVHAFAGSSTHERK
jgi:hypothetical protein